jgi:ferredoxin
MTQDEPATLVVDMVKCDGHGICAWLFPDRVELDDWGYAWVDATPIESARERRAARAAVRACPRRALSLVPIPATANTVTR